MAYALFNSGAAAAYANSFRQRSPYGNFKDVKSNVGTEIFSKIPFMNFKAEVEMAKAGLEEAAATKRQAMVNDASIKINEMRYDKDGDKSTAKKQAIARMLGSGGSGMAGSGSTAQVASGLQFGGGDPLDRVVNVTNKNAALDNEGNARLAPLTAAATQAIQNAPKSVGGSGAPVAPVQAPASTKLQTPPVASVKSKQTKEELVNEFLSTLKPEPASDTSNNGAEK
jgi:hypothetical protein